jgi:type IV pilus assembly protein PilA
MGESQACRGFSMLEILVAVAIVGVLATLAVPGLYASAARNQILESAPLIDVAKKQVAAYWAASGDMPANNAEAGLPDPAKMVSNYVRSVTVSDGVIDVLFGNRAGSAIADKVLSFRPAVVDDAPIVPVAWVCAAGAVPEKMNVRGQDRTSAPMHVLPVNCRG